MPGIMGGGLASSVAIDTQGLDAIPSTVGETLGAEVGAGFAGSIGTRAVRSIQRSGLTEDQTMVDSSGLATALAPRPDEPEPLLDPADANAKYGIKGVLSFDKPVTDAVAAQLYDTHHADILRQDKMERAPGTFAIRTAASFLGGMLDPTNLALGLIPGVGEATVAGVVGTGLAGRVAARAVSGFTAGAFGTAAAEPLNYLFDQQEHDDWSMSQALRNVAFGGLLGGGLHIMGGALSRRAPGEVGAVDQMPGLRNPISERIEAAGPEAREAALQGGIAQHLDGQPVNVAAAFDAIDAARASDDLGKWVEQQRQIERANLQPGEKVPGIPDRTATLETGRARLEQLRADADQYRQQIAEVQQRLQPDAVTADRLQAIEEELGGTIPAARRDALVQERDLLTQGRDVGADALDRQRDQTELQALQKGSDRAERAAAKAEADLAKVRGRADAESAQQATAQQAASRADRIRQARLDGQEAVTRAMTERSIRRMAGEAGVRLAPEEVTSLSRRVLGAQPDQVQAEIRNVVDTINARQADIAPITAGTLGGAEPGPGAVETAAFDAQTRLRQEQRAATAEVTEVARGAPDPVVVADDRNVQAIADRAPQLATPDARMTEAQAAADRVTKMVQTEVDAGRLPPETLKAMNEAKAASEGDARAHEAAAACLATRML